MLDRQRESPLPATELRDTRGLKCGVQSVDVILRCRAFHDGAVCRILQLVAAVFDFFLPAVVIGDLESVFVGLSLANATAIAVPGEEFHEVAWLAAMFSPVVVTSPTPTPATAVVVVMSAHCVVIVVLVVIRPVIVAIPAVVVSLVMIIAAVMTAVIITAVVTAIVATTATGAVAIVAAAVAGIASFVSAASGTAAVISARTAILGEGGGVHGHQGGSRYRECGEHQNRDASEQQ